MQAEAPEALRELSERILAIQQKSRSKPALSLSGPNLVQFLLALPRIVDWVADPGFLQARELYGDIRERDRCPEF